MGDSSALNLVAEKQSTGSAEGANYQQDMYYQKYLGSQGDSQGGAQGGNSQHYTQQYAPEYQKYMHEGGGDDQKDMQRDGARTAMELTSGDIKQLTSEKWPPLHKNMTRMNGLQSLICYPGYCNPVGPGGVMSNAKQWAGWLFKQQG